jgi:hypothetical protein
MPLSRPLRPSASVADTHETHHERRVPALRGVVLVAGLQHLIERRPDPAAAGLDDRHPEVARRIADPVEVAGDNALGGEHERDGVVRELLAGLVVLVAEADRIGEVARRRTAVRHRRPERPVGRGGAVAGEREHAVLSLREQRRVLGGVDADVDGQEVLAELQAGAGRRLDDAVEHQAAKHRAAVVAERDHHRLALPEQRVDARRAPGAVGERQTRYAIAEVLDDVDVLQGGQRLLAALRKHDLLLRVRHAGGEQDRQGGDDGGLHLGAPAGSVPPAIASIARSIGT